MKLTKKELLKVKIINDHDYANGEPYLIYCPSSSGFVSWAKWAIVQKGKNFGTHWTDNGNKTFNVYSRKDKVPEFNNSVEWMKKKFNIDEVVKTPMGGYMDKVFVESRNKELEHMLKELKNE